MKYFYVVLLWSLTLSCSADSDQQNWTGEFNYSASLGTTVGGSNMYVDYTLYINQPNQNQPCVLKAEGFQTGLLKLCSFIKEKNKITILFKSYQDGSIINRFGYEIPKVGQALFSLISSDKNKILTQWFSTECPSEIICNKTAVYFLRIK